MERASGAIWHNPKFVALILALIAAVLYVPSFWVPFYLDDIRTLVQQEQLVRGDYAAYLETFMRRLVPHATFALDHKLWGDNPAGYHLISSLIHVLSAVALFFLSRLLFLQSQMNAKSATWLAFIAAALWAFHPLNSQAVVYIVQRITAMAALFFILSMLFWVKARLAEKTSAKTAWFLAAVVAAVLAVLSKEFALLIPLAWYLLDIIVFRKGFKYAAKVAVGALVLGVVALLVGDAVYDGSFIQFLDNASRDDTELSRWEYFRAQPEIIAHYLYKNFIPYPLLLEYPFTSVPSVAEAMPWILLHIVIIALAIYAAKWSRLITFGVVFYYVAHLIESGVIPIIDLAFEHRAYVPNLGIAIAVTALTHQLSLTFSVSGRVKIVIVSAVLLVLGALTVNRILLWADQDSFYKYEVEHARENPRPYAALGRHLAMQGQYEEAEPYLTQAFEYQGRTGKMHEVYAVNYLTLLIDLEKYSEATQFARVHIPNTEDERLQSRLISTYMMMYLRNGMCEQAMQPLQQALQLDRRNQQAQEMYQACQRFLESQQ